MAVAQADIPKLEALIKARGTRYCLLAGKVLMVYRDNNMLEQSYRLSEDQKNALQAKFPFLGK